MMLGLSLTMWQEGESWVQVDPLVWAETLEEAKPFTLYASPVVSHLDKPLGPQVCLVSAPISPFDPSLHQALYSTQTWVLILTP